MLALLPIGGCSFMHAPPTASMAPHTRSLPIHMGKPKRYIKARPSIPPVQPAEAELSEPFSVQGFPACLVLNADYSPLCRAPLSLWGWQDVVRAVMRGTATTVSEHEGHVIRSPNFRMKLPSVVVLNKYVVPRGIAHTPTFSRYNVFLRDDFTCQYCNCQFRADLLTYDHVVPRSLNGPTTWDNVVTSCSPCNAQKAGKALSQLKNMELRKMPHAPTRAELQRKVRHRTHARPSTVASRTQRSAVTPLPATRDRPGGIHRRICTPTGSTTCDT